MIWAGLAVPPELFDLQNALAAALNMEPGRFQAHFTLGRIKAGRTENSFYQTLEAMDVEPVLFEIDSVYLMQSERLPAGMHYTPLGVVPLAK